MRIVMKFGGTSVGDSQRIKKVAKIVERHRDHELVVVVSAFTGVTDTLVEMAERVAGGGADEKDIKDFISELKKKHQRIAEEVAHKEALSAILEDIERFCREVERVLMGILYVGELTPRSMDYVLSLGERVSAPVVRGALEEVGIKAKWFTGSEAGIITDANFGRASPIWEITNKRVKKTIAPLLRDTVPVVTGFIATDEEGMVTTLGRGGSDYTAAIIGSAIDADEIWIWTDVDGIMSTDPRVVGDSKTIPVISYVEAMELSFFGAKVLYPKSIEPAMEKNIPVRVRNTFNPRNDGTLIVSKQEKRSEIVKAVSIMDGVSLVNVSGAGMIGVPGVAARVFGSLAREGINIIMISQGSSEANISLVVQEADAHRAVKVIKGEFEGLNMIKDVRFENISVIAVVGAGMRGMKGVAARVFASVAKAGVNVLMIAQGSSEVNISFIVQREDAKKAAVALHKEFALSG